MSAPNPVDLDTLGSALLADARAEHRGRATEVVLDQPGQRVLAMAFVEGKGLPEHDPPPAACLHVLHGEVTLVADAERLELSTGDLVSIPHRRHHLEARTDSLCLLTVVTYPAEGPAKPA